MREHKTISIADQIFEQLERDILSGKYQRGEVLSENRLAEDLGVSRTPIREAIRRLEQEKIVENGGKGITVVGITREDMPDMYEIRIRLETLAAARCCANITGERLSEMYDVLDMQKYYIDRQSASGTDNSDYIKDLDSRFHELLYECSASKPLCDILKPLHKRMTKFRKASVRKNSRALSSWEEHMAIYEAIKSRDEKATEELVKAHLVNARDSIMNIGEE